ncbi:MAG: LamG-like jellyroll fold domain-containing protein, partial [Planctomycetota bacterium]
NDTTYYWRIDEVNAGGTTTGSVWSFTTEAAAVPPPGQASNPSPADSAANVAVNTDLSWTAGSDTTSHDVYFGTSSPGAFQGNQTATTFDTGTMANDTTYYWRIDEVGLGGTTTGNVWSFATIVAAPGQASNPSPGNGATDVSINADLSWSAGSGATSHDVYFGTSSPGTFQGNQTATTFDTGTMANDTTYYWRIDEINAAGTTTGSVWSFTTIVAAPAQASSPSPANGATDVSISADLSWTAGSGATSHDVYFGTTSPGSFQGNQTATTFDTGTMANDTTYYWRIDELNAAGTTTGTVWSFTTIVSTGDEIIGWWELDDASGSTAADSSAYTNDGTLVGPPAWTNDAEQGWCLDFTGAGNYVTIPNESFFDLTDSITVTAWMKASYVDWRNFSTIIAKGRDGSGGWALQKASRANAMSFFVGGVTGAPWDGIKAGIGIFDGEWHHVAGVYDGSASYIYIDGGLDSNSVSCSGSISTNDWPVYIGENSKVLLDEASSAREWEGHIDDVRVYNYALTQSQINDIYTGGAPTLPGQASSPSPADSATDVSIDADLSWTAGSDTTSHDVYFGTSSPGTFQGNQTATTFDPSTMSNDTTCIDEVNAEGTTTGNVWSFTTVAAPAGDVEIVGSWVSGTSHTAEAGTNRLLVFTTHAEDNNADMNITSVTYGGQAMTKVIEENEGTGYRAYAGLFILDEAGINAASGSSFVVTWAEVPNRTPAFTSVFMQNVNQASPVGASASAGGTTATISTSALSTSDGDMVVLAAACGNTGTYSVNNGFTETVELTMTSADGVAGYKAATGANETPSVTHSNINRQAIVGLVVQAQ